MIKHLKFSESTFKESRSPHGNETLRESAMMSLN